MGRAHRTSVPLMTRRNWQSRNSAARRTLACVRGRSRSTPDLAHVGIDGELRVRVLFSASTEGRWTRRVSSPSCGCRTSRRPCCERERGRRPCRQDQGSALGRHGPARFPPRVATAARTIRSPCRACHARQDLVQMAAPTRVAGREMKFPCVRYPGSAGARTPASRSRDHLAGCGRPGRTILTWRKPCSV